MRTKLTTKTSIIRFHEKHGIDKYDYSKFEYKGYKIKSVITCIIHGDFLQTPDAHFKGQGCPKCGSIERGLLKRNFHKSKKPDLSHVKTINGSKPVPLTKGKYAIVDEEDYDRVMEYNWSYTPQGYAINSIVGLMHRFILNCKKNNVVDHKNHDTLDNRKSNIRECNQSQNMANHFKKQVTSKYKGVSWDKARGLWKCTITVNSKQIYLGRFDNEMEAAKVYNNAACKYFGTFSLLNNL